jgi:hypothetical protein
MPKMPEEYDPFVQQTIYDELELKPYADMETVNARLQEIAAELEEMPDNKKDAAMATFQMAMKKLKSPKNRIPVNLLIPDCRDDALLATQLDAAVMELSVDDQKMPSMEPSSILLEGEMEEFAQEDFQDEPPMAELQVDLDALKEELRKEAVPRYISFET